MELQACGPGAGMTGTAHVDGTVDEKPVHLGGLAEDVAIAHARSGCGEPHQGRDVRHTSAAVTMVGARWGGHDESKSRRSAAS